MTDLFGNDHPDQGAAVKAAAALSLFDATAERLALASGRPVSQERGELLFPSPVRARGMFEEAFHV